ncbi:phosphodiester glycosidase family protein [Actinophytocola xanthii]|uniref:Sporulation domain-containing protein n=1 Tax=Actinophytocola xanthii TaxID=1912961 RepID=A0A1Q8CP12_9PSEU|nr:phosphodiester glycosidase family protein [Actinophytocola xanthii]OLF16100.1 sporulation domain-containing protein [Actinophytocola xanthii]
MSGVRTGTGSTAAVLAAVALVAGTVLAPPAAAEHGHGLPLGPADLPETRTLQVLQPGVTLTTIVRGEPDPANGWTVEVAVPGGGGPDPDTPPTAVADREHADRLAGALRERGFAARVEEVDTRRVADHPGGTLGFRVRIGHHAQRPAADAVLAQVRAAGFTASTVFTGWDGDPADRGPWRVQVLTVDPRTFRGDLVADFGPDLEQRETTSALAAARDATAAVNAGFFVLDPAAGAPGDPAGLGVYDGRLLSEAVDGRPVFAFGADARHAAVARYGWIGTVSAGHRRLRLDGLDRVPGLIRNCGGTRDDLPTFRPLHDTTCTDPDELVAFTTHFGAATPSGPGVEAVLDRRGRVLEVREPRGGDLPPGGSSVQATGSRAADLRRVAVPGATLTVGGRLTGAPPPGRRAMVVNGGPELVRDGRPHATPRADGMVRPGDPSFYYGWVAKRNPRTIAGVDARGRILLVTVDGRGLSSLGLSIPESADVAAALGMRDAVNLDGGGSTTMVVGDRVVNTPSDAAGERPVGDAILVLR